jgi:hypothetical protein
MGNAPCSCHTYTCDSVIQKQVRRPLHFLPSLSSAGVAEQYTQANAVPPPIPSTHVSTPSGHDTRVRQGRPHYRTGLACHHERRLTYDPDIPNPTAPGGGEGDGQRSGCASHNASCQPSILQSSAWAALAPRHWPGFQAAAEPPGSERGAPTVAALTVRAPPAPARGGRCRAAPARRPGPGATAVVAPGGLGDRRDKDRRRMPACPSVTHRLVGLGTCLPRERAPGLPCRRQFRFS